MITGQSVEAKRGPRGDQVVELVADQGYRPRSIAARAGVPLRLIVHRHDNDVCMDRIVFSSPHLERQLARGTATTIILPAQPPGEIRFTCGMGRYQGQIELRPEAPSPLAALRSGMASAMRRGGLLLRGQPQPTVETHAHAHERPRETPS